MRALAASLRSAATAIASADDAVWRQATPIEFEGPAARQLADAVRGWHGDLGGAAAALSDTADFLLRAATQVEEENERLRRLAEAGPEYVA